MLSVIESGSLHGIDALPIHVEVNTGERGELRWVMVGLPDAAVKESQNRVFSALGNCGFTLPLSRTTINLAPGDVRKEGPMYDLPIALAVIAATQQADLKHASEFLIAGELSLSGKLRSVPGAFNLALLAKKQHKRGVILPSACASAATFADGVEVYAMETLRDCVELLRGSDKFSPLKAEAAPCDEETIAHDLGAVRGQRILKRAVEIAVAGSHNILFVGPPGCGKSMIAKCIPELMPPPTYEEWLEILKIQSACGLDIDTMHRRRPFRSPHHNVSDAGLIGGGIIPKPGEISLAHNGVLIVRTNGKLTFPCRALCVAAMNPCPCGYMGSRQRACTCSQRQIQSYRSRLSGPLLDRFDVQLEVQPVDLSAFQTRSSAEESSLAVRQRIMAARKRQTDRCGVCNAYLSAAQLETHGACSPKDLRWLQNACEQLQLSARAYHKVLRIARTIADLESVEAIQQTHLMEAMQYRCFDRAWR